MREIPLQANTPHQTFSVALGDHTLEFSFHWVVRYAYFRVDIRDLTDDVEVVTQGRIAHLGVNLLSGSNRYGRVLIVGQMPTLGNLGTRARLMWEEPASE